MTMNSALTVNIKRALRANLVPAIFLQAFAIFIGLSYFYWPASQGVFKFFAALKLEHGLSYAIVSTAFFGGVIPFMYLWLSGRITFKPIQQFMFFVLVWGAVGALVNEFYQFQSFLFGDETNWQTIVKKTAFDQFGLSMLFTCPLLTLVYLWKDQGFSWSNTQPLLGELIKIQIPTTLLTNWLIWIPAVSLIYLMPPNLQVPLFNLVLCFFVLIFAILHNE